MSDVLQSLTYDQDHALKGSATVHRAELASATGTAQTSVTPTKRKNHNCP